MAVKRVSNSNRSNPSAPASAPSSSASASSTASSTSSPSSVLCLTAEQELVLLAALMNNKPAGMLR